MSKREIPLREAEATALKIVKCLEPLCSRVAVAGSLRRQKPTVHDIDIVVIPQAFNWPGIIPNELIKQLGAKVVRNGPDIKQLTIDNTQVDLIRAEPQNWGIRMLRWTGSTAHNIKLCTRAKQLDMKLAVSKGLLDKYDRLIEARDEKKIFEHLKMEYVEPKHREVNK